MLSCTCYVQQIVERRVKDSHIISIIHNKDGILNWVTIVQLTLHDLCHCQAAPPFFPCAQTRSDPLPVCLLTPFSLRGCGLVLGIGLG